MWSKLDGFGVLFFLEIFFGKRFDFFKGNGASPEDRIDLSPVFPCPGISLGVFPRYRSQMDPMKKQVFLIYSRKHLPYPLLHQ
jgi:hypothetical protein